MSIILLEYHNEKAESHFYIDIFFLKTIYMSDPNRFQLNVDTLVVGSGTTGREVDIISYNGADIKINGIVPSGGGGSQLPINGTGDITVIGDIAANDDGSNTKGKITSVEADIGSRGLTSTGDIDTTGNADIISGRDFYFDGTEVYKRTINQGVPTNTAYYRYRNLAVKQEANEFSGENHFIDIQYFGTSDNQPTPTYTDNITLNNVSGNITSVGNVSSNSANIDTQITCGNITCDNGSNNTCKAKIFNTRTSGTNGWDIKQELENNAQSDNILQIAATQQQVVGKPVEIYITSSEYNPQTDDPNIKLVPDTVLNGGQVQASQVIMGTGTNRFQFKQDIGGTLDQVLQINAKDATSEVRFRDNISANILTIKKTSVDLGNTIPLQFNQYVFQPIQYKLTRTIEIRAQQDTTNYVNMVFNALGTGSGVGGVDSWTRVNDGATGVSLYNFALEGFYKCVIEQTATSSAGNFERVRIVFDYILSSSIQDTPDITPPISFGFGKMPTNQADPIIVVNHNQSQATQSQPVFLDFPSQNSNETMQIEVRLTKLDF
jgi:hypothetical protein